MEVEDKITRYLVENRLDEVINWRGPLRRIVMHIDDGEKKLKELYRIDSQDTVFLRTLKNARRSLDKAENGLREFTAEVSRFDKFMDDIKKILL